jgi:translation initiation factor IF-2
VSKSRRGAVLLVAAAAVSAAAFALWPKVSSTVLDRASTASPAAVASPELRAPEKTPEAPIAAAPKVNEAAATDGKSDKPSAAPQAAAAPKDAPEQKADPLEAKARHRYRPAPAVRPVVTPATPAEKPKAAPRSLSDEPDVGF